MNFVRCHRFPIVFRHLTAQNELLFAGTQKTTFDPAKLVQDEEGYLLYEVSCGELQTGNYGSFDTELALQLSDLITFDN